MRRAVGAACTVLVVWATWARGGAAAADTAWGLALEGGSEYDTNVHRLESTDGSRIVASPLVRGGARLRLALAPGRDQRLLVSGFGGVKLYGEPGEAENVAIAAGDARYEWRLPERRLLLGLRGSMYDTSRIGSAAAPVEPRHFSTAGSEIGVTLLGPAEHRLTLAAGYQGFVYEPNPSFDWHGDEYGMRYRTTAWLGDPDEDVDAASIDVTLAYQLQRRRYQGDAFTSICGAEEEPSPRCFTPMGLSRADLHHMASAEVVYTGDRIYSARYELVVADSNSVGQSLVRQRLELGVTSELVAGLFVTAKAALQLDVFLDSLLLARDVQAMDFTTIDDENRNALSLHVSRDLGRSWSIEGRYALHTNEFATEELAFRRQIFYLGAVYQYAR